MMTLPLPGEMGGLRADARVVRALDAGLFALIVLNVAASVVGTMAEVEARFGRELAAFETFSVAVFTVEYAVRLWAARRRLATHSRRSP
jgi:voltage-gated potassium channel